MGECCGRCQDVDFDWLADNRKKQHENRQACTTSHVQKNPKQTFSNSASREPKNATQIFQCDFISEVKILP